MSKILTLKTILTKNNNKKINKTDGCMRRLQQVSNINIINTKLITVTDIDSMSLHVQATEKMINFDHSSGKSRKLSVILYALIGFVQLVYLSTVSYY